MARPCAQRRRIAFFPGRMRPPRGRFACKKPMRRPPSLPLRSEEHTSELQSLMRISYAVFCLKKKKKEPSQSTVPEIYDSTNINNNNTTKNNKSITHKYNKKRRSTN